MENQIIQINLVPNMSTPAVVRVSQYDIGRPLVFKVYDGTSPADLTGVTAVVEGTKRSGLGFSESGTVSDNTVTLDTTLAMTQEDGSIPAEIRFTKTGEDVGTANFILSVEKSPHPEGTTDGTQETMADLQSQLDALDTRVEALEAGGGGGGLTEAVKSAMLQIAQKVAYIDEHGQTYYDALYDALYPPADLVSITAVYTQSGTVYDTDTLDSLRSDLVVTAHMSDSTTQTVTTYTLSGTLATGTSTITVAYGGKTTTFTVTVTHAVTQYTITNNLTNCTNSNSATVINEEASYSGTLTATSGNIMSTVAITMGGTDVTSTAYNSETGAISIASVTGNVVITAEAVEDAGWVSGVPYDMTTGATANYYLNNGAETQYNGWSISPYMECHGAFVISDTTFSLNYNGLYDENNTYINKKAVNSSQYYNFDEYDAASLRVSEATSKVTNAVITPYRFDAMTESTVFDTTKHYTPSEWTDGAYINVANGSIINNSAYKYSGYMNCYNASYITDTVKNQSRGYCFYDGNKDFISGVEIASSDATLGKQTTVPNNARYFRVWKATPEIGIGFTLS